MGVPTTPSRWRVYLPNLHPAVFYQTDLIAAVGSSEPVEQGLKTLDAGLCRIGAQQAIHDPAQVAACDLLTVH